MFVFDSLSSNLPVSISNYFSLSRDNHRYNTRGSNHGKLVLPPFKSVKYGKYSIKYQCTSEWNKSIKNLIKIFLTNYGQAPHYKSYLDLNRNQFIRLILKLIYSQ